ncbi:MAG: type II toxin-antitoxin system VapC family toxin [Acidimicrobiales bacterium]
MIRTALRGAHLAYNHVGGVLAQVEVTPTTSGLPGGDLAQKLLDWLAQGALWGCLATLLIGGLVWGLSARAGNSLQARPRAVPSRCRHRRRPIVVTDAVVGVLDTNTLILIDRLDAGDLPEEPVVTAVTLAELSVGPLVAADEVERAARQVRLQETEAAFEPLPFDAAAARAYGRVAASLRRSGRKSSARAFDALIAATVMANDLDLYTCNPKDFEGIDGLNVIAIPTLIIGHYRGCRRLDKRARRRC